MTTSVGFKTWGSKQSNELNRRFALFMRIQKPWRGFRTKGLCRQTKHTNCVLCLFSMNVILAMMLGPVDISINVLLNSESILKKPVVVVVSFFTSWFSHLCLFFLFPLFLISFSFSVFLLSADANKAKEEEEKKPPATPPPGQPVQSPLSSHRKVPPVRDVHRVSQI